LCPDCGNPRSVCSDPNVDNFPQRSVCWVTAAQEVAMRAWHKKIGPNPKPDSVGYLPTDGVRIWMSRSDLTPDDDFLSPVGSQPGGGGPEQGQDADDAHYIDEV
jgi:hypothetical protein